MKHKTKIIALSLLASANTAMAVSDQEQVLSLHNKFRAQHQAPNLHWDAVLANYAQKHANTCRFRHSSSPYGENIAAGYPSISASVRAWYGENADYSYGHPGFSYQTGHFTQMVWRASKKLGCGFAACNGKNGTPGSYLVCEYSPRGNITSRAYFKANVLP